jgi:hypothetical protein
VVEVHAQRTRADRGLARSRPGLLAELAEHGKQAQQQRQGLAQGHEQTRQGSADPVHLARQGQDDHGNHRNARAQLEVLAATQVRGHGGDAA